MTTHQLTQAQRRMRREAQITMRDLLRVVPMSEWAGIMAEVMQTVAEANGSRPADAAQIVEATGEAISRAGHMAGRELA